MRAADRGGPLRAELVLVGAGHAHVQVLRSLAMRPLPGVRTTLVVDRPEAVYSGMVPGFVAGDYAARELEIDAVPLARRAGARVVLAPARRVDAAARRIEVEGRPALPYDLASLDVGSSVRGLELPGVREHALATRPIRAFVDALEAALDRARRTEGESLRVASVGGGAAGVELVLTLEARLRAAGVPAAYTLLFDGPRVLAGHGPRLARAAEAELRRRGVELRRARASGVAKDGVLVEGALLPFDLVLWAAGAAPPELVASSPLPRDDGGFVRVRDTFQVDGFDDLFAVGDCASLGAHPEVPKAGVYAVRSGPVLEANLRRRLAGRPLRRYRPQRDFLALLNLGDRRALGGKWGLAVSGSSVWWLKDRIDRRFVERFRSGGGPPERSEEPMACGGCAAKLAARPLARALGRLEAAPADGAVLLGLAEADDAAAVALPGGQVLLATLDAFRPFTDDPFLVGRVAAVNALSDVAAKGGRPRYALALVTLPEPETARAEETLVQVLAGIRAALDPLGVSLVGGHTTTGPELFVGLAVTGELGAGDPLLAKRGLRPGEALVLTKPLGTGVVFAADALGEAPGRVLEAAIASMLEPNLEAAALARASGARACTDISGFGLAGHLAELLRASGVRARLDLDALPALPGALELLARGFRSSAYADNEALLEGVELPPGARSHPAFPLLFDPQTSGGLLFGAEPARLPADLRPIGRVLAVDSAGG
jgi:selenide,water dikinase